MTTLRYLIAGVIFYLIGAIVGAALSTRKVRGSVLTVGSFSHPLCCGPFAVANYSFMVRRRAAAATSLKNVRIKLKSYKPDWKQIMATGIEVALKPSIGFKSKAEGGV